MSTNNTNPTNYQAIATDLDTQIESTRRRNALNLTVGLVSLGLLGFWLGTAYSKFSGVTADFAVGYGASEVQAYVPRAGQLAEKRLIELAPELVATAEKKVLGLPDTIAAKLKDRTEAELDQSLPRLEEELYQSLKVVLTDAAPKTSKVAGTPEAAREMIDTLAEAYGTETRNVIQTVYDRYNATGGDILAYLDYLAENKELDKTEQLHREMLTSFLALAARHQIADAGDTGPTPPIETADDR